MKFKLKYIIYLLFIFSLTSCDFDRLLSILEELPIEEEYTGKSSEIEVDRDIGNSIKLLDNAFNSKVDNNGNSLIADSFDIADDTYENVKRLNISENAKDLEYNQYLTPSKGTINSLVIPVDFSDYPATTVNDEDIYPNYQSVSSYYYNTSYGQLQMNFDVLGWQRLKYNSSHYEKSNLYEGDASGASEIIYEVLNYLKNDIDLSKYDNDNDGIIDSLYIIYSRPYNSNSDFWWAYQYLTYENYRFDNLLTSYYVFASYDFLLDENMTLTYIHETGHMFGLEDYYDYDDSIGFNKGGLGAADMMDYNFANHNPFSKMSVGWINNPLLVTSFEQNESVSINLKNYETTGDVIMLCDNYDSLKGMFQDYFLIIFTDPNAILNKGNSVFTKKGVRVYRVHGELKTYTEGKISYKYFKYDNSYTNYNLIDAFNNSLLNPIYTKLEYQQICAKDSNLFTSGDTCSNLFYYTYQSSASSYNFKVDGIYDDYAKITIKKVN